MRKNIAKLALITLVSLPLASCNNQTKQYSLTIWTYYNGDTETSFQKIVEEYNNSQGKENHIAVNTISQGSKVNDLLEALLASANGDFGSQKMPDMFLAYPDTAFEIDKKGKIVSLDKYFTNEELANFNEGFLNEGKLGKDQTLKVLPVAKSTEALFINKTDFDKFISENSSLGIAYDDLETIEGLIDVSEKYFNVTGKAFFGRDSLDNYFVISAKQLGIDIIGYDENKNFGINFDHDIFKKLWDSYAVPLVKGYFNADGNFRSSAMKAGSILAYVGSTSSSSYFPDVVLDGDEKSHNIEPYVMTAPTFKGKEKYAVSQGAGFCVTKADDETEKASINFLKWLTKTDNISKFCQSSGYFPSTKDGFNDAFINSQTNEKFKQSFKAAKTTTENFKMYTNVVGDGGTSYRNTLKNSLTKYCSDALNAIKEANYDKDLINTYASDAKFEEWYSSLVGTNKATTK